jgi:PAS domain S-box-containing protein
VKPLLRKVDASIKTNRVPGRVLGIADKGHPARVSSVLDSPSPTVLIIDDDQGLGSLIRKALRREGIAVVVVRSGQEALSWLARNHADLLLLDLKLHDIEGKELINHLSSIQRPVPFIIITGQGDERVAVDMIKRGALDYLVKDVDFLQFLPAVIRRAFTHLARETRLIAAEEALRQSEANLSAAQKIAHVGSYEFEVPGPASLHWSAETFRILGLEPAAQDFCFKEYLNRSVHPDDRARVLAGVERTVSEGARYDIEYRVVRPDGSIRNVHSVAELVVDKEKRVRKIVGALQDITDRKRTEEALRHSEANLASAQQIAHVGSYEINVAGAANDHWSVESFRILGLDPAGQPIPPGDYIKRIVHPEDRGRVQTSFGRSVREGVRFDAEYRIVRPDGTVRHVHSIAEPVLGQANKVMKLVGSLQDVTVRKELEKEVREIGEREQRRIGCDLHDGLGQQLTAIELMCESLRTDLASAQAGLAGQAARICQFLREAVRQTRSLAHGLAAFKVETDGLQMALMELAQDTASLGRLKCRFDCLSPVSLQDTEAAAQLYRIAQEALNNAVRHSRASEVIIQLSRDDGGLRLQVKDNGTGLPKTKHVGNGMGLHLMKHRASMIGAELEIQSRLGKGVTVTCALRRNE